ncbi:uncharacterized protein EI90DRAFT_155325 [Cantharellus anzutake]|uniref:uncharacterized protein n=1 Tax=Cantharellus anzutake TaxID=1750568 RepID=UPI001908BA0C|nr:uncharacterized protein EI90DRAFT_155325 [Cantharellus anzutake]KAF8336279.1 hypothetical protein EI90DRAFT_155325 [Cantharellus anzutake]
MSVASALNKQGHLAASFFWDKNRKGVGLASIEHFPSTLARQLALFNAEYEGLLVSKLRWSSALKDLRDSTLEQMRFLIVDLMHKLLSLRGERPVIVLDGLDECGVQEDLESLMKLVFVLDELPATFAVLVSCWPESSIVSAWDGARAQGLIIPCEDVDIVAEEEKFHTIRCMVEEGLRGCVNESSWKPSKEDIDAFATACHGLPIITSIRIRGVSARTRRGETLQSEFEYLSVPPLTSTQSTCAYFAVPICLTCQESLHIQLGSIAKLFPQSMQHSSHQVCFLYRSCQESPRKRSWPY